MSDVLTSILFSDLHINIFSLADIFIQIIIIDTPMARIFDNFLGLKSFHFSYAIVGGTTTSSTYFSVLTSSH